MTGRAMETVLRRGGALAAVLAAALLAPGAQGFLPTAGIPGHTRPGAHSTTSCARPARLQLRMMYGPNTANKVIVPQYVLDRQRMAELTKRPFNLWDPLGAEASEEEAQGIDLAQTCHSGGVALRKLYHESDRLLMVLYHKDSCSMCRVLRPLIQKVVDTYEGEESVHYVKLEVLKHQREADRAKLSSTPVLHFIKNGKLLKELSGLQSKKTMKAAIDGILERPAESEEDTKKEAAYPAHWEKSFEEASGRDVNVPTGRIGSLSSRSPRGGASAFAAHEGKRQYEEKDLSLLNEKDEMDREFIRVLNTKVSSPNSSSPDAEAKSGKRLVGRLADGEVNLQYSSDDAFEEFSLSEASIYEGRE